jgi:SAM-dependent methyltransferase
VRLRGVQQVAPSAIGALEDDLQAFYLSERNDRSLYDTWEQGRPRGDATTPSICSTTYRWWILEHLRTALDRDRRKLLLSVGAGNAFVERVLCREGYLVLAVDALEAAVRLARRGGVPAIHENLLVWEPRPECWDVIYADGLLGHLHDEADGVQTALCGLHSSLSTNGMIVISNDAPVGDEPVLLSNVPGFYWLSGSWIVDELRRAGFTRISVASIDYERPLSGLRSRAIVTAHRG